MTITAVGTGALGDAAGRSAPFVAPSADGAMTVSRTERLMPWLVGAVFALPVLIARFPPMADLPLHEASVGLLRHWSDDRFTPKALYELNLGQSNQLFSLLVLLLSFPLPITWASKVVVAGSLFALPLAAAHFATHVRAPRSAVLLVAPIGFGWLFFWGLIQNIIGIVILLAFLPTIDRFAAQPTWRKAAGMCGVILLFHLAHQAMMFVACIALALCSIGSPVRSWKSMLIRAVPFALSAALIVLGTRMAWRLAGPRLVRSEPYIFYRFSWKLESIPGVLFGGFEPYIRNSMMLIGAVPIILFAIDRARLAADGPASLAGRVHRWRFELFALVLFVLYLASPASLKSTTLIYHRFLPPAWAILATCIGSGTRQVLTLARRAICAALPVGSLLITWPTFADSHRIYSGLEGIVDRIEPGSTVMVLKLGHEPSHRLWSPTVAMGHIVALRGGRALFDYTQSPVSPVVQRPDKEWVIEMDRLEGRPLELRPAWDFVRFRYLALVTSTPGLGEVVELALRGDAHLVASQGDWFLFESNWPVVPTDADDAPVPMPPPPTLQKKLKEIARELDTADVGRVESNAAGGPGASPSPKR